jgi:hypothetical protein
MFDIHLRLDNRPGELGRFGEAMGEAGISIEGGGVFTVGGDGHAHFLVADGAGARQAAERAGLDVVAVRRVLVRKLDQARPGQLGAIGRCLGEAGVNIVTMYSDHANCLILVTEDEQGAEAATVAWRPDREAAR